MVVFNVVEHLRIKLVPVLIYVTAAFNPSLSILNSPVLVNLCPM